MVPVGVEPELFNENKFKFKGKHSPGESSPIFSFSFKHEDEAKRIIPWCKKHMAFGTEDSKIRDDNTLLVLARQKRDEEIYGKPNMSLYFDIAKARDDNIYAEFGRV